MQLSSVPQPKTAVYHNVQETGEAIHPIYVFAVTPEICHSVCVHAQLHSYYQQSTMHIISALHPSGQSLSRHELGHVAREGKELLTWRLFPKSPQGSKLG